jgi:hypothetical protein
VIRDMCAALLLILDGGRSLIARVVRLCAQFMTLLSLLDFEAKYNIVCLYT